jgi:anthranilate phosphoribosyltransferase
VNIDPGPELVAECIRRAHIGFMFAPKFHPAMKYVQPIRKALGFRTVFNLLGPLANPAGVSAQVLGAADEKLMPLIAETLNILGVKRAMVVHSEGLDEISTMGKTKILHLKNGRITADELNPIDCDIALADFDSLKGGDAETNAEIIRNIICGDQTGAGKDIVLLNAAASIIVSGLAGDFKTAIELAQEAIKQGGAKEALDKMIEISNS